MSKLAQLRALRETQFEDRQAKPKRNERVCEFTPEIAGAKGGKSKSPAKRAAAQRNGKKGGRPRVNNDAQKTQAKPKRFGQGPKA